MKRTLSNADFFPQCQALQCTGVLAIHRKLYSSGGDKEVQVEDVGEDVVFPRDVSPCPGSLTRYAFSNPLSASRFPVNTTLEECLRRNSVIRPFLSNVDWKMYPNCSLLRSLFVPPTPPLWEPYREKYPLVFDYGCRIKSGVQVDTRGDLQFTDGHGSFLVVTVKSMYVRARSRRKKRCLKFACAWHEKNPQVKKTEAILISEKDITEVILLER